LLEKVPGGSEESFLFGEADWRAVPSRLLQELK